MSLTIQRAHKRTGDHGHKMSVDGPVTAERRGVLKFLSFGGMALVGGLAGVFQTAEPASAGLGSPCCHLASNTRCKGSCYSYTCPSGYNKRYWWCLAGTRPIGCGECQKGSGDCWSGTSFACSTWWDDNAC